MVFAAGEHWPGVSCRQGRGKIELMKYMQPRGRLAYLPSTGWCTRLS